MKHDQVIVRGERRSSVCNLSTDDGTIDADWMGIEGVEVVPWWADPFKIDHPEQPPESPSREPSDN